jgi:hypothetical protein
LRGGFESVINLNLQRFSPEVARRKHIEVARKSLNAFLARQGDKPGYQIFADGIPVMSEDAVRPFGVIQYVFLRMGQVGKLAIQTARDLSPVQSGRYKKSWMLIADRNLVNENSVPNQVQELILVNNQPYARKIHVRGARIRNVPPGIVEKVRQIVLRKYRQTVVIDLKYIELEGAYVLKNDYVQVRKSGRRRLHTKAGTELTYPALVMTPKY